MKVLITSGGCKVPIDDVRHIGNFSSGRYGAEIAEAVLKNGHEVLFVSEKGSQQPQYNWRTHKIRQVSYSDYFDYLLVKEAIKMEQPDIIISAAAISDYICDGVTGKISSDSNEMIIKLRKAEKVIASFRELAPNALIVGFKCLVSPTEQERSDAIKKVLNYTDLVVYNDLTELRKGNATRKVFPPHLGTLTEYDDTHCHNCKTASELIEAITEHYCQHLFKQEFGV